MAYRLMLQEPVAQGVRRVALEQLQIAETKLASDDDVASAIHDARRSLKRLRALLHLVRPGLDEALYRREVEHLSAIGKLLSGARDRFVMQQTIAKLEKRADALPKRAVGRLRKLMSGSDEADGGDSRDERRQALLRLKQARKLFSGKAIADLALDHIGDGLENTYRKARKAFRKAYDKPSDETFHASRKSAQLHWRHMLLLSHGWPEALSARAGEAKELSRLLGEDHDYSVLVAFAQERAASALSPAELAALTALCRSSQEELRAWARPRGDRLFAEKAEDLKERLTLYWSSGRCLSGLTSARKEKADAAPPAASARVRARRKRKSR